MKKRSMFLLSFVIFTFTALTSVIAQKTEGILSVNFQEIVNNPNPYLSTVEEYAAFRKNGTIPAGIAQFHAGLTRADAEKFGKEAGDSANFLMKTSLVDINDYNEMFALRGKFTSSVYEKNSSNIELSIKRGRFNFYGQAGQMYGNLWVGNDLVTRMGLVNYSSIGELECFYFDFGQSGIFPFAAVSCFNGLPKELLFSVVNTTAELMTSSGGPNNNRANKPNSPNGPNNPNGQQFQVPAGGVVNVYNNYYGGNATNTNTNSGGSGQNGTSPKQTSPYQSQPDIVWSSTQTHPVQQSQQGQWVPVQQQAPQQQAPQQSNTMACGNCGGYQLTKEDVAFSQRQQLLANRYAKRTANSTTSLAVTTPVLQVAAPFIAWGVEKLRAAVGDPVGGGNYYNSSNNYFASNNIPVTPINPGGNPVDNPNGGGQAACIAAGGTWDGTQCHF